MAYLRGTSVVDGNLYVEGELNVKSVRGGDGSIFPYVPQGYGKENHIVKFSGIAEGEQIDSYLVESVGDNNDITIELKSKDDVAATSVAIKYDVNKVFIKESALSPVYEAGKPQNPEYITGWKYN